LFWVADLGDVDEAVGVPAVMAPWMSE